MSEADARIAVRLFGFSLAVYLLTAAGAVFNGDGGGRLELARALLDRGAIDVADGTPGVGGKRYSPWSLAQPLLALPLLAGARAAAPHVKALSPEELEKVAYSALNQPIAALAVAVAYLAARRSGSSPGPAAAAALGYGFATIAWQQSKDSFEHPLIALCLLLALVALLGDAPGRAAHMGAGLALAGAVFARPDSAWMVAAVLAFGAWRARAAQDRAARWACLGAPVGAAIALVLAYNRARFGSALEFGLALHVTTPLPPSSPAHYLARLGRLFVGDYRGVLWFAPWCALALLGAKRLARRQLALALTLAGGALAHALFVSTVASWSGQWCWGPRHLTAPLALTVLFCAAAIESLSARRAGRALVLGLALVSFGVQVLSIAVNYRRSYYLEELEDSVRPVADLPGEYLCGQRLIARQLENVAMAAATTGAAWRGGLARSVPDEELARKVATDVLLVTWHVWWWHAVLRGVPAWLAFGAAAALLLAALAFAWSLARSLQVGSARELARPRL